MPADSPTRRRPMRLLWTLAGLAALLAGPARAEEPGEPPAPVERVRVDTNLGSFVIRLENARAPLTTANFLNYVKSGHYNGTVFHRVIQNFVIQGGGNDPKYQLKTVGSPVANESGNGLSNKRFTVGLARSESPHSGNAQFYVNLTDNDELDPTPLRWGYAVFGRVVDGLEVVEKIGRTPTGSAGPFPKDAPVDPVVIQRIEILPNGPAAAAPAASAAPPPPPPPPKPR
jgi:cyclophilin family peptidyl-prolyl cis-trans isomerase